MLLGKRSEAVVLAPVPHRQYVFTVPKAPRTAHVERFASVHGLAQNLCRVGRHLLRSATTGCCERGRSSSGTR